MALEEYICYNGNFLKKQEALFGATNRAFRYGDGIFETIRVIKKELCFFDAHWMRLSEGMNFLGMKIPSGFSKEKIHKEAIRLLNTNRLFGGARLRLSVFRSPGGHYSPLNNLAEYLIESEALQEEYYSLNKTGISLGLFEKIKKPVNELSRFKSCNALIFVIAGLYCNETLIDDCIILNENNKLCECLYSNIFIAKGDTLFTPSLSNGCVDGIMRSIVIDIAVDEGYIVFDDANLYPSDLFEADEVFLTNAVKGIMWVVGFMDRRYFNNISKKLINRLNEMVPIS